MTDLNVNTPSIIPPTTQPNTNNNVETPQQNNVPEGNSPSVTSAPPASTDVYGALFGKRLSLTSIGLGVPTNLGNAEAVLADLADKLETIIGSSRSEKAITEQEKQETRANRVLGALFGVLTAQLSIGLKKAEKAQKETELADKQQQLSTIDSQIATVTSEIATLNGQKTSIEQSITNTQNQLNSVNNQLATVNATIAALQAANLPVPQALIDTRNSLNAQKSSLEGSLANLNTQLASVNSQISAKNTELSDLNTQKAELQGEIDQLKEDIAKLTNEIALLTTAVIFSLFFGIAFLLSALFFMGRIDSTAELSHFNRTENANDQIQQGLSALQELDGADQAFEDIRALLNDQGIEVANFEVFAALLLTETLVVQEVVDVLLNLVGEALTGEKSEQIGLLGAFNKTDTAALSSAERVKLGI